MSERSPLLDNGHIVDKSPSEKVSNIDKDSASSIYPSVIPAEKFSQYFDSQESSDLLIAQLKKESQLYRQLSGSEDIQDLEERVQTMIGIWGFSDYSFFRIDTMEVVTCRTKRMSVVPTRLLSSYGGQRSSGASMLLQLRTNDMEAQHQSLLSYYSACQSLENLNVPGGLYILLVSMGGDSGYLSLSGAPEASRYFSMFDTVQETDSLAARQHFEKNRQSIDLLTETIVGVGISKFADHFCAKEESTKVKINYRPLRLLDTLAKRDVALSEAASILCVSPDTVNKHVASAKMALGTTTIAGTIWKAVKMGLIDDN